MELYLELSLFVAPSMAASFMLSFQVSFRTLYEVRNEPGLMGLCAQGIFHALSGYTSIASGSGTTKVFIIT